MNDTILEIIIDLLFKYGKIYDAGDVSDICDYIHDILLEKLDENQN